MTATEEIPNTPTSREVFETLLILGKIMGFNRSVAIVFATLYSHHQAYSIDDLVAETNLSKSAVSLALRDLLQLQAIYEKGILGERSRYYGGLPKLGDVV